MERKVKEDSSFIPDGRDRGKGGFKPLRGLRPNDDGSLIKRPTLWGGPSPKEDRLGKKRKFRGRLAEARSTKKGVLRSPREKSALQNEEGREVAKARIKTLLSVSKKKT